MSEEEVLDWLKALELAGAGQRQVTGTNRQEWDHLCSPISPLQASPGSGLFYSSDLILP